VKKVCYIALASLAVAGTLSAQTNATTNTAAVVNANTNAVNQILALVTTNPPPAKPQIHPETVIEAEGAADFDQAEHGLRVIYRDHVRVESPGLKLWCEWLAADLDQATGHVTNIVAKTNVVIDATDDQGQKMHANGDQAVYVYNVVSGVTNETVTLTGNAKAEYKEITLTGDPIIWDRGNDRLTVPTNPKMVFHQNIIPGAGGTNLIVETNAPVAGTNSPVVAADSPMVATNRPVVDTNFPPGKLDLIPSKISKPESK